jgi:hypothetical protein
VDEALVVAVDEAVFMDEAGVKDEAVGTDEALLDDAVAVNGAPYVAAIVIDAPDDALVDSVGVDGAQGDAVIVDGDPYGVIARRWERIWWVWMGSCSSCTTEISPITKLLMSVHTKSSESV